MGDTASTNSDSPQPPPTRRTAGLALLAGLLVAASLPPWGWWPLAWIGLGLFHHVVTHQPRGARFRRGWLFGLGWLTPGTAWMWFLTAPGYIVVAILFATFHGLAMMLTVTDSRRRWFSVPAAITAAEALRFCFPFGGVPLASLPISQVAGPLAPVARVGGPVLMTFVVAMTGSFVAELFAAVRRSRPATSSVPRLGQPQPVWRRPLATAGTVVLVAVALGHVAPDGHPVGELDVAFVQGGGPQGTRAINTKSRDVMERHLAATRTLQPGPELVVWPENVIDVPTFSSSVEYAEIAAQAARVGAPFLVGVTEDVPNANRFLNAQITVEPDGQIAGRYDKVRRVPFGEYVPLRSAIRKISSAVDQIGRDAVAGTEPAYLDTSVGRLAVVISWEVFFAGRARDGVKHGGLLLINPTNGSSYTWTILQTQQIASSRLRAIETGRWVVQTAPTGFSAFVSPSGEVFQRSGISEQAVRQQTVELRSGTTWAVRTGDKPWVALMVALLLVARFSARRSDRRSVALDSDVDQHGDRSVVDE